jgi:hypothetical protein
MEGEHILQAGLKTASANELIKVLKELAKPTQKKFKVFTNTIKKIRNTADPSADRQCRGGQIVRHEKPTLGASALDDKSIDKQTNKYSIRNRWNCE